MKLAETTSCFLVCLWDEMKNRMSLADVLLATIKSRPAVCWGTHKMKKQPLPSPLRHDYGDKVFQPRKSHHNSLLYCSVLSSQLLSYIKM